MKLLIIICEGETEQEFCKYILSPYLFTKNIIVQSPLIKKSGGGIGSWESLKKQILKHLNQNKAYVTTFIDLYGIKNSYCFPNWMESMNISSIKNRIRAVEKGMNDEVGHRSFIANIIVHEFETILFSNIAAIEEIVPPEELYIKPLQKIIRDYPDIELINNGTTTAPSKRLEKYIVGYEKTIYGHYIAEQIGLSTIRQSCDKFNEWIEKLEKI